MNITINEIATFTGSQLIGNPDHLISSFSGLSDAASCDLSYYSPALYDRKINKTILEKSEAGAIFIVPGSAIDKNKNYLLHPNPALAFEKAIQKFFLASDEINGFYGIHKTAVISENCTIGESVSIGPNTVIDKGTTIGNGTTIGACCYIGPNVTIGKNCQLFANVTVCHRCVLKDRIVLQPGAVIGSSGFGYYTDEKGRHTYLKQMGIVVLEDDVEIGANTTIDRARFEKTCVKRGTKIDNLVQIGHSVTVGEDNLIVSQSGIAGSTKTGRNVIIGAQVGIKDHIEITSGVIITSRSGVSKSLKRPGKYGGVPATNLIDYNRNSVQLKNIDKLYKRIELLEKRLLEILS